MGKVIAEEDELLDLLDAFEDEDEEAIGVEDADALDLAEIEDAPEDVGLDVETFAGTESGLALDEDDDDDGESALDDSTLDIDGELDDDEDEHGWTEGSEGTGDAFDEPLEDEDDEADDDGGLEGVDDPLIDALVDEHERSIPIDGVGDDHDSDGEGVVERLELDLG